MQKTNEYKYNLCPMTLEKGDCLYRKLKKRRKKKRVSSSSEKRKPGSQPVMNCSI